MTTLRSGGGGGGGGKQDLECDNPGQAIQTKLTGKNFWFVLVFIPLTEIGLHSLIWLGCSRGGQPF